MGDCVSFTAVMKLILPQEAPLLNSEMAGLPLGIFETCAHKWQPLRRLISPLFTNMKLKKVKKMWQRNEV